MEYLLLCTVPVFLQSRQTTWTGSWLWRRLATPQSCSAVLRWWSVWQKASRSPWCPGAGKVRDILAEIGQGCLTFTTCSINKWGHWHMVRGWQREAAIMGWLEDSQCLRINWIYRMPSVYFSRPWYKWSVSVFTSDSHLSIRLFLWQLKARETISTSLNACLALSDQTGSPFPLMWLSSRPTWWLGTRGVTTLAFTCAEPTSRRPENLLPRPPSFMCLVQSFYALNSLSFSLDLKLIHHQIQEFHFWCLNMKSRN